MKIFYQVYEGENGLILEAGEERKLKFICYVSKPALEDILKFIYGNCDFCLVKF